MPNKIFPENTAIEKLIGLSQEYWCVLDKEGTFRTLNEALKKELPESGVDTFKALLKLKDQTGFIEAIKKAFEDETAQEFLSDTNLKVGERKVRWRILADNQNNLLYCVGSVIKELVDQESNKLVKAFDQLNITLSNEKFSEKELSNIQNVLSDRVDKFKLISQNVSDIVCLHEPKEARYLYVSPSLKDVTGYDPSDFVGKTPYDFFHPDMQRLLEEDHKKKQQGEDHDEGPPPKMLYKIRSKDGGYIWLESHSKPIFDDSGNVIMILSTSRDVTERVDAEQEKEKFFEYYRILGNNIPNGAVFLVDKDFRFLIAEGQEFKKVGRTPDYYLNKTIYEIYDKDRLDFLKPYFESVVKKKEKVKFEYEHEGYDYTFLGTPYLDDEGEIVCGIFLTQNVSESKSVERQLRNTIHELEFQKSALDASALVSITNPDGIITYVNNRFCDISGYSKRELIGNSHAMLRVRFSKKMDEIMRVGEIWHGEIKNKAKSGSYFWVDTYVIPFKNKADEIEKYVYIRFDITDRKRAEEDLKAKNFELDAFAYHTSHDLRAPLSSITGLTTLISSEANIKSIKYYNSLIESSIKRLDNFIKSVMIHSQNKNLKETTEVIDFEALIEETLQELKYKGNFNELEIIKTVNDKGGFHTDKIRLSIIFKNLLTNSVKYTNPNRTDPRLKIDVQARDEKAHITIEDNGIGIRKEYLTSVFNMFYRANDRVDGSGLGLYIVKQTVDRLKGKINIESQYGEGTKILLTLPNLNA